VSDDGATRVMALAPLTIVRRRLAAQRLTGEPFADVAAAVASSGAVQAQEHAEALWSLSLRAGDRASDDVQAACDRGDVLRTHVLRPTWHFVAAADLAWMLRLTGARIQARNAGRYRQLGLDAGTLARVHEVWTAALSDGEPRTRKELDAALRAAGVDTAGQRIAHMLLHAELEAMITSGPRRGKQHTYLRFADRVPAAPERSREDDVAELALRYFAGHGPATLRDFAWWSGLTVADGRAGIAAAGDRLSVVEDEEATAWIAAADAPAPVPSSGALLLGVYDEMTVAYRDLRNVHAGGRVSNDLLPRPIVVDGETVGTWRRVLARREVVVEATLQARLSAAQHSALRAAADRYGAFVGLPARLKPITG
jgi:hypothetical protein